MSISEVIQELNKRGVEVLLQDGKIKLRAPSEPQAEAQQLIETLKQHKAEAFSYLTSWPDDCRMCGQRKWWLSIYGVITCGVCHPPGYLKMVRAWFADNSCEVN